MYDPWPMYLNAFVLAFGIVTAFTMAYGGMYLLILKVGKVVDRWRKPKWL